MSDYTKVNLKEIDDSAGDNAGKLEAHFGRKLLDSEHLGVSHFATTRASAPLTGHAHREQEEIYVVINGSGRIKLNDEIVELKQWDTVRVAPAMFRRSRAARTGSSSSRSAPTGPRAATGCEPGRLVAADEKRIS